METLELSAPTDICLDFNVFAAPATEDHFCYTDLSSSSASLITLILMLLLPPLLLLHRDVSKVQARAHSSFFITVSFGITFHLVVSVPYVDLKKNQSLVSLLALILHLKMTPEHFCQSLPASDLQIREEMR